MRLRRMASSTPAATVRPLSERRDGSTCRPRGSTSPTLTPAWTGTPSASRPRRSPAMGALTGVPSTSPTGCPARTRSPIRHRPRKMPVRGARSTLLSAYPATGLGTEVSGAARPRQITRPRLAPRCVSTTAWTFTPATKPGPRPMTVAAWSIRVSRARLAMRPSTTASGCSSARLAPSGSTATGTKPPVFQAPRIPDTGTSRPAVSSTAAVPLTTASARHTRRRTASGASRSSTATWKPARNSRRAAAEPSSPPPRIRTGPAGLDPIEGRLAADLQTPGQLHLHRGDRGRRHRMPDRDHLGQHADRDLFRARRADLDAERAVDLGQVLQRRAGLLEGRDEMHELGPAPEKPHEAKPLAHHRAQRLGVALVAPRDHDRIGVGAEGHLPGGGREVFDHQKVHVREALAVGELDPVIGDLHAEARRRGHAGQRLGHVPGAEEAQGRSPLDGLDEHLHPAATDQPVLAGLVRRQVVRGHLGLAGFDGLARAPRHLGLDAATADRADDPPVGVDEHL